MGQKQVKQVENRNLSKDNQGEAEKQLKEEKEEKKAAKRGKSQSGVGKKYQQAAKKVADKSYAIDEALQLVKKVAYTKFDGTVEAHLQVKSTGLNFSVDFPYDRGKKKKIAIADDKDTMAKIEAGEIDFDVLLASPAAMKKLMPYGRILGPQGLMPNPKAGTLVDNPEEAAEKMQQGSVTLRTERKSPLIHTYIGKVSQDRKELKANWDALEEAIGKHNIKKATICATMGPGVRVALT